MTLSPFMGMHGINFLIWWYYVRYTSFSVEEEKWYNAEINHNYIVFVETWYTESSSIEPL